MCSRANGKCPEPRTQYQTRVGRGSFESAFASCNITCVANVYLTVFSVALAFQFRFAYASCSLDGPLASFGVNGIAECTILLL